jgi:surface polysaccharide O-acyltransferase-like enzyme
LRFKNQIKVLAAIKLNTEKLYWISNLRVLATICVVFIHTSGGALIKFGKIDASTWWAANLISGLGRFTVPVFVMISGALLLGKELELFGFLQKRILKVWVPFSIWVVIYVAYHNIFEQNPISLTKAIQGYFTGGNGQYGHLWFVYMILGLYLFTPIINYFVLKAAESEIIYFLGICFLSTTIFMIFETFFKIKISFDLSNFGSYIGYFVAGYYLKNKAFTIQKYWYLFTFGIGYAITLYGTYWLSSEYKIYANYFYNYFSPNSVLMSLSIFMFFKEALNKNIFPIIIEQLDRSSFGIYLSHLLIINILSRKFAINWAWHTPFLGIFAHGFLCLAISFALVWVLAKLPFGKWLVG